MTEPKQDADMPPAEEEPQTYGKPAMVQTLKGKDMDKDPSRYQLKKGMDNTVFGNHHGRMDYEHGIKAATYTTT